MNDFTITLKPDTVDNLQAFSELLHKDINTMLDEALQRYFEEEQQKLFEKGFEEDASMTNLDYDEFWDGLDIG
jgi:tRNA A37 N6-isopentenylltransferase MiaA